MKKIFTYEHIFSLILKSTLAFLLAIEPKINIEESSPGPKSRVLYIRKILAGLLSV